MNAVRSEHVKSAAENLRRTVGTIARELQEDAISPGDRAALTRGPSSSTFWPAFWRIAVRHLEPTELLPHTEAPWRREAEDGWALVVRGMATTRGLHRPGRRFGQALVEAGVSEGRLLRLLRAAGGSLETSLRSVLHQLASTGTTFDWREVASFVLAGQAHGSERTRRRIARDYYRALRQTT